jgi:MFS family permease
MPPTPLRLIAMTGLTNLAFWLLWPASIVRVNGLEWGAGAAGLFGSAAPLALFLALPLASRLTARLGPRPVLWLAVLSLVAGGVGSAVLTGGVLEWVWTALLGFGTGLRWIAADSWIADASPPERSGRILSIGETVVGLGFAAGPAIASSLGAYPAAIGALAVGLCLFGGSLIPAKSEPARAPLAQPEADGVRRFAGLAAGAVGLLLVAALLGGLNETGFAGVAPLLALASGGEQPLLAAAAVGLGSFAAQYGLGAAADRWGGCKMLMGCAALLATALAALALAPSTLPLASFVIGGAGGGLYTVAVVFGLQARRGTASTASMIGAAALAYSFGTLVAPAAVGLGLDVVGAPVTLGVMAAFAAGVAGRDYRAARLALGGPLP